MPTTNSLKKPHKSRIRNKSNINNMVQKYNKDNYLEEVEEEELKGMELRVLKSII